eukprot:UN2337
MTENSLVVPPDYTVEEACLEDIEETLELFIAKPPLSTALGMDPEGPVQKACDYQHVTWQSACVEGRSVAVNFYKGTFTREWQKCIFDLDTLAWSRH